MTPTQVALAVLAALGNTTPAPSIVAALVTWFEAEGGAGPQWGIPGNLAAYNPLNTTLDLPGSTPTPGNAPPVRAYVDWPQGIAAIVQTLRQANMAPIYRVLAGNGTCAQLSAAVAASPWGTGGFARLCPEGPTSSSPPSSSSARATSSPPTTTPLPFLTWEDPMTLDQMHTFVRWCFQTFLLRQPESAAVENEWVTVCNGPGGTEAVMAGIIGSAEGQRVQAAQRKALGLDPPPAA